VIVVSMLAVAPSGTFNPVHQRQPGNRLPLDTSDAMLPSAFCAFSTGSGCQVGLAFVPRLT